MFKDFSNFKVWYNKNKKKYSKIIWFYYNKQPKQRKSKTDYTIILPTFEPTHSNTQITAGVNTFSGGKRYSERKAAKKVFPARDGGSQAFWQFTPTNTIARDRARERIRYWFPWAAAGWLLLLVGVGQCRLVGATVRRVAWMWRFSGRGTHACVLSLSLSFSLVRVRWAKPDPGRRGWRLREDVKGNYLRNGGRIVSVTQTCFPRIKAVYASIGRGARGPYDAQCVGAERVGVLVLSLLLILVWFE